MHGWNHKKESSPMVSFSGHNLQTGRLLREEKAAEKLEETEPEFSPAGKTTAVSAPDCERKPRVFEIKVALNNSIEPGVVDKRCQVQFPNGRLVKRGAKEHIFLTGPVCICPQDVVNIIRGVDGIFNAYWIGER